MRYVLKGGFYNARAKIADSQRCLNLYPETNTGDSPDPVTHYPTPGLLLLGTAPNGAAERGSYLANNGQLFRVHGGVLYAVSSSYAFNVVGYLTTTAGIVSMIDDGTTMIIVDGSTNGFRVDLASNSFELITDIGFYGGDVVAYTDGYFVLNIPGTKQFYISDVQTTDFTQVPNFASKEASGDKLVTLAIVHREIWLLGESTTEVFFDSGDVAFPFQRMPGVFVQHGIAAKYSLTQFDLFLFWLGRDPEGKCIIFMGASYQANRISTHPIETIISKYETVDDAIGGFYQVEGHPTYVLTFPTADATWAYDLSTKLWHEWAWMDGEGELHRVRPNCFANAYGKIVAGDNANGNLYALDTDTFSDNGDPILRLRSFPSFDSDVRIKYDKFTLDMSCGVGQGTGDWENPTVNLRWSEDNGSSWGSYVQMELGELGAFNTRPTLWNLGIGCRRVFEVSWASPIDTALNGAWIDYTKLRT